MQMAARWLASWLRRFSAPFCAAWVFQRELRPPQRLTGWMVVSLCVPAMNLQRVQSATGLQQPPSGGLADGPHLLLSTGGFPSSPAQLTLC